MDLSNELGAWLKNEWEIFNAKIEYRSDQFKNWCDEFDLDSHYAVSQENNEYNNYLFEQYCQFKAVDGTRKYFCEHPQYLYKLLKEWSLAGQSEDLGIKTSLSDHTCWDEQDIKESIRQIEVCFETKALVHGVRVYASAVKCYPLDSSDLISCQRDQIIHSLNPSARLEKIQEPGNPGLELTKGMTNTLELGAAILLLFVLLRNR